MLKVLDGLGGCFDQFDISKCGFVGRGAKFETASLNEFLGDENPSSLFNVDQLGEGLVGEVGVNKVFGLLFQLTFLLYNSFPIGIGSVV